MISNDRWTQSFPVRVAPPCSASVRLEDCSRGLSSDRAADVRVPPRSRPTSSSKRNVNPMRFRGLSTSKTFTRTMSPDFTIWRGSFTKVFAIAETWIKPS